MFDEFAACVEDACGFASACFCLIVEVGARHFRLFAWAHGSEDVLLGVVG